MEDLVTISDDEDHHPTHTLGSDDTIILEDALSLSQKSGPKDNIIEVEVSEIARHQIISIIVKDVKIKNELLGVFIEKCFDLENSDGMLRIINKTLMKYYTNAEEAYKISEGFKKVLTKSLRRLESDPGHKFLHLKHLCDTLRFHEKKRVKLTTLATNLEDTNQSNLKRSSSLINRVSKIQRIDSVILDSDEDSIINLEENQADNDVILLDDDQMNQDQPTTNSQDEINNETQNDSDVKCHQISENNNGNTQLGINLDTDQDFTIKDDEKENINENVDKEALLIPKIRTDKDAFDSQTSLSENEELFLTPKILEVYQLEPSPTDTVEELDKIHKEILRQKMLIRMYDEQEVTSDSPNSPYLLSERAKTKIVQLYKQVCELTGQRSIKRRKVRLQVLEGHPPGPTRKLEEFINGNIGEDGYAPFPDFPDVVKCVLDASTEDELGWHKSQVMKEASSLFSQCGRALQKRRQHREYRDLISLVKVDLGADDGDPADGDPALLRKLEDNRRIALRKESEVLERFTMMQFLPPQPRAGPSLHINNGGAPTPSQLQDGRSAVENVDGACLEQNQIQKQNGGDSSDVDGAEIDAVQHQNGGIQNSGIKISSDLEETTSSDDFENDDDADSESSDSDLDDSGNDSDSEVKHQNDDSSKNVQESSISHADDSGIPVTTSDVILGNVKIKQEPVDISKMLDALGDDYTTTILDIEDPFLVIEISSDSDF